VIFKGEQWAVKNLDFLVFFTKKIKTSKVQILVFLGFSNKPLKIQILDSQLYSNSCCLLVQLIAFIAVHSHLHMATNNVAGE